MEYPERLRCDGAYRPEVMESDRGRTKAAAAIASERPASRMAREVGHPPHYYLTPEKCATRREESGWPMCPRVWASQSSVQYPGGAL